MRDKITTITAFLPVKSPRAKPRLVVRGDMPHDGARKSIHEEEGPVGMYTNTLVLKYEKMRLNVDLLTVSQRNVP